MNWNDVVETGGLAVITGGASGVGLASAHRLAALGFELLLADVSTDALDSAADSLRAAGATVAVSHTDVSDFEAVAKLADRAFELGSVAIVMNNAGVSLESCAWDQAEHWRRMFEVNFFGVLNGVQAFMPRLIAAARPAVVINTGSKQGITTPPGNPGYNATKAAVKVLTEQLAHELRDTGAPISAHLFVPGFTWTGMTAGDRTDEPDAAWTAEQTVHWLFERVADGDFYVLCPDNAVSPAMDAKRVAWAAADITENRSALSRWDPKHADAFERYMQEP